MKIVGLNASTTDRPEMKPGHRVAAERSSRSSVTAIALSWSIGRA